ncbi:MAG TPA: VOC family protein [Anaerolineales bacterium]|nr:VOC family protein [Anaerolineales bacterium]
MNNNFTILSLKFPSFYLKDYDAAIAFYTKVFGPPENDEPRIKGWKMGDTWLTFFPAEDMGTDPSGNPRNAEFAIQVATPGQVDVLYNALLEAGAKSCRAPEDTRMYDQMRFCCVDDPFGIRVDVYCPL